MFKKALFGVLVVSAIALLVSCTSFKPFVVDDALPEEETALVYCFYGIFPRSYNGIPLKSKSSGLVIRIPAGDTKIAVDIDWFDGRTTYTGKDALFRYNFEAGKTYSVIFTSTGGRGDAWGVEIYNDPLPKIGWPKKSNFIAFVPFEKQR